MLPFRISLFALILAAALASGGGALAETCCAVMPMIAPAAPGEPPPLLVPISPGAGLSSAPPVAAPAPAPPAMYPAVAPMAPAMAMPPAGLPPGGVAGMPAARGVYTVQKGARLYVVAQRTGTRFADLILLNPKLEIDRMLPAGTRVLLPIPGNW